MARTATLNRAKALRATRREMQTRAVALLAIVAAMIATYDGVLVVLAVR